MTTVDTTPASQKQIEYVKGLVAQHTVRYKIAADAILRTMPEGFLGTGVTGDYRDEYRRYQANLTMHALWQQVVIPASMSSKRASAMIDRMKKMSASIVGEWLDGEKAAKAYGVDTYIDAHRDEIERALGSV